MTGTATMPAVSIDAFGLTDRGRRRDNNEDHFLIAAISKSVDIRGTSLSSDSTARRFGTATAQLFAVADGVGGRPEGDLASERTVSAVLAFVGRAAACFHGLDVTREHELFGKLEETILGVHEQLQREYAGAGGQVPATTLTLVLLVWPRAYLVHVGDSRAYARRRGRLQRLTQDQTYGEYMVALGAWPEESLAKTTTARTLSSAVGGSEVTPVIGLVDLEPGDSLLLCTDGLTVHLGDERIAAVLDGSESAEATCRRLIEEALEAGGKDNVTAIVVRTAAA
jgi:protein phosphatase